MKRIIISVAILLAAIAAFFLLRKNMSQTSELASNAFALKQPDKIDKFFYADKNNKHLTFTKKDGNWYVENGSKKYEADTASISLLLKMVMTRIAVQAPVDNASLDNVTRDMAIHGIKAEFYSNGEVVQSFFVGSKTSNDLGTYMHMPGTDRPCIVRIPGQDGYLNPFFNLEINNWRSQVILNVPAHEIKELSINWNERPENGFVIRRMGDDVKLFDHNGNEKSCGRNRLLSFLEMFSNITREGGEPAGINRTNRKDSVINSLPFFEIAIVKTNGEKEVLQLHHIPVSMETYSPETREGVLKVYETETYWGVLKGSGEIWVMQDAIIKNRMKTLSELLGNG